MKKYIILYEDYSERRFLTNFNENKLLERITNLHSELGYQIHGYSTCSSLNKFISARGLTTTMIYLKILGYKKVIIISKCNPNLKYNF